MSQVRQRRWLRPTAGISLLAVVSLTCAPICGNALDVDSVTCCKRHGCIPTAHNDASMEGMSHLAMVMTPVPCDSIGFDTQSCCLEGELTYPTAQVRAPSSDNPGLQVVAGFVVPVVQLPSQSHREKRARIFASSPPTPLYTLHATFRI